jgi:hypothetical protein
MIWFYTFFMGMILTIGSIERTLQAGEGRWFTAGISSLLVSLATWFSITAAAEQDCILYGVFAAGTILATVLTAKHHQIPQNKTTLKSGTVLYTFPGAHRTTAAPCPACSGSGRKYLVLNCNVCDGAGAIMFQYQIN